MANIKNIVKVMNFHSLVRVDKAKKEAQKFFDVDKELDEIVYQLINNKSLKLDKKIMQSNPEGIVLNIYIANDMGFCADFNTRIRKSILEDKDATHKIIIGKKVFQEKMDDSIILQIRKKDFFKEYSKIDEIVHKNISSNNVKEINVIYNKYVNASEIVLEKKQLFPIQELEEKYDDVDLNVDYVIEADISSLFTSIISLIIFYQIQILEKNCWASENIMRERVTRESIQKIEEMESSQKLVARKMKMDKSFKKQLSITRNLKEDEEEGENE